MLYPRSEWLKLKSDEFLTKLLFASHSNVSKLDVGPLKSGFQEECKW